MKAKYIIITIFILIAGVAAYLWPNLNNQSNETFVGSDNSGFVTKETYSHLGAFGPKIAIITGMHSREISAKNIVPQVIKNYAAVHNVEIVNYQINVTDEPDNFKVGRQNGEGLVAKYVVPDIAKSDYSLVIICHDHRQGYGTGYYLATPTMDNKSVELAESAHNLLPDFNYYQRNVDEKPEESSINGVDGPIVATGTPVFVYEIPEWLGDSDVYNNTTRLIDTSFKII